MDIKLSDTESYGLIEMIGQLWEKKDCTAFEQAIAGFIEKKCAVVVADMSRLSFISSQGLGRLVRAFSMMREQGGQLVLLRPSGSVRETIEIAGFTDFMKICNSEEDLANCFGDAGS